MLGKTRPLLILAALLWTWPEGMAGPSPEMLGNACAGCHGTKGVSAGSAIPSIAGMPAAYLEKVLSEFKSGQRPATIMDRIAKGYTTEEIQDLAGYFSAQTWVNAAQAAPKTTPEDDALLKKGQILQEKCAQCHKDNGRKPDDDWPRLAGQWEDYLLVQMQHYKEGKFPLARMMAGEFDNKSLDDLRALAHFYASQK